MTVADQRLLKRLNEAERRALQWFSLDCRWTAWGPNYTDYDPAMPTCQVMSALIMHKPALVIADAGQVLHRLSAAGLRLRALLESER